jgi:hypothetical protein
MDLKLTPREEMVYKIKFDYRKKKPTNLKNHTLFSGLFSIKFAAVFRIRGSVPLNYVSGSSRCKEKKIQLFTFLLFVYRMYKIRTFTLFFFYLKTDLKVPKLINRHKKFRKTFDVN